ncbi:MAG TPA: hypothetical protein VEQ40_10405 [Pyrinomonadaceae bacterium]|nr:hypothetical protein [Pyrinomonadaceae bacterium]
MQLIYAVGGSGRMSFGVTNMLTSLPAGASVYAVCDGTSAVERVDEHTYAEMTEREYLTFKQMVNDAHRQELVRVRSRVAPAGGFRRFLQALFGVNAIGQQERAGAY